MTRFRAVALLSCLVLPACVSNGDARQAEFLARAGERASFALSQEVRDLVARLDEGDAAAAFATTWAACSGKAEPCDLVLPSSDQQMLRDELSTVTRRRLQAIDELLQLYKAIKPDPSKPAEAEIESSRRAALSSVNTYASAFSVLSSPLSRVSAPLVQSVGYAASLQARHRADHERKERSREMASALKVLAEALASELQMYDVLAESLVRERIDAHRAMLQAGLASGSEALRPVAQGLRMTIARDADAVVTRSPAARRAVEAMIEASERATVRRTRLRYRAAIQCLQELETLHRQFGDRQKVEAARLDHYVATLESLRDAGPTANTLPASR